jgi:hypothetical protein
VPPLPTAAVSPPPVPAPVPPSEAARTWAAVKDSTSITALEEFRRQYGKDNPVYDRLAEARIAELKKQQTAPATHTAKPDTLPVAPPAKASSKAAPRAKQECFTFNHQTFCN